MKSRASRPFRPLFSTLRPEFRDSERFSSCLKRALSAWSISPPADDPRQLPPVAASCRQLPPDLAETIVRAKEVRDTLRRREHVPRETLIMQELLRPPPEALNVHTGGPEACAEGAHPVLVRALTPPRPFGGDSGDSGDSVQS